MKLFNTFYDEEVLTKIGFLKNIKLFSTIKEKNLIYILESLTIALICFVPLISACMSPNSKYSAEPFPKYDSFFDSPKKWNGADGSYSVKLSSTDTLWFYNDTWIESVAGKRRDNAAMINNSIAIQRGKDISTASVKFYWGPVRDGKPTAFIEPTDGKGWFWIYDGITIENQLYVFLMQIVKTDASSVFGFELVGTWLAQVENPRDNPLKWRISQYKIPWGRFSKNGNLFFGSAIVRDGDFVYIYGSNENWKLGESGRRMVIARVPFGKITDFKEWRFYGNGRWLKDTAGISDIFDGLATEYSVSWQPSIKKYAVVYTENGSSKNILMRLSSSPTGPWSVPYKIYECPEYKWSKNYFCYAAKAHPAISADNELIISYVTNSTDFGEMARDMRIYWPRFIKIDFSK